jgi:hypothetical protein
MAKSPLRQEGNSEVRTASWLAIIGSHWFGRGFADARAARPFFSPEYDKLQKANQWLYERGRLFAFARPQIERLKEGRRVLPRALLAAKASYVAKEWT